MEFRSYNAGAQIDWAQLKFTQVAGGATAPTSIADAGDGTGRLFVTEQPGLVMLIQSNGVVPFLDIQDRVQYSPGSELGLLSVAFPPGFATNQHFYVFYTRQPDGASTVSRFFVSPTNANLGDSSTEQILLVVPPHSITLSGGLLSFGPDGYLYIGMGDSGFLRFSPNQAQNPLSLQGKILRIDTESSTNSYQVPVDNPFIGNTNYLPEIWALGVRNPWKFSFDRATADFYMGDVGQLESEEVDFKAAATPAGQNYGWPIREGFHLYAGPDPPPTVLVDPVAEFLHTGGASASITGGFVYRGLGSARMAGVYLYADAYSGRIWGLARSGTNWMNQQLAVFPGFITTFGEDQAGELYLADYISGNIYHIEDNGEAAAPVFNPPGTNSFTETITVSCISSNAVIHFTLDGSDPNTNDSSISSGEVITVSSGTTLSARAFREDLLPSPLTSQTYNLVTARPGFNPSQGPVTNGQPISILCATSGATVCFTLDGSDPTSASTVFSNPVPYDGISILKARAFKTGFADSAVATFSPASMAIQTFDFIQHGVSNTISCSSLPGRTYGLQVSEDLVQWRDFGGTQIGTGGTLILTNNNVYPLPIRRMFRVKAVDDFGL